MTTQQLQMLFLGGAFIFLILFLTVFLITNKKNNKTNSIANFHSKKKKNHLHHIYLFFSSAPFFKKKLIKIKQTMKMIYPADEVTVNIKSTKLLLTALISCIGMIIISLITSKNDIFFLLCGLAMSYLLFCNLIENKLAKLETLITNQLREFIDQVRENYNRLERVDDAILQATDKLPYEIGLHAAEIHKILTSVNIIEAADAYITATNNHFLMTFVAIASTTMEFGDKNIDDGGSLFLKNLNFLKEEINIELIKRQKTQAVFSGLTFITLLPILLIKPIEYWAIGNMPEIAEFYKGSYGIITMTLMFVLCVTAYTIIKNLKTQSQINMNSDNSVLKYIANRPKIQARINAYLERKYTKALKIAKMLKTVGDKNGIQTFVLKRYVIGFSCCIVSSLLLISSIKIDKSRQIHDFHKAFDTSRVIEAEDLVYMAALGEEIMIDLTNKKTQYTPALNKQISDYILNDTEITDETNAAMLSNAICHKLQKYNSLYFKWYYLLMIFGAMGIGYGIPYIILFLRQYIVNISIEDEVAQFQTLILILMHVDGVDEIILLEWMERFAIGFKESITSCIISYPHQSRKALEDLQEKEKVRSFQNIVNGIMNIRNVGIEKSFSTIETDRNYYKQKRAEDNELMLKRKLGIAKWIAMLPIGTVIVAYLIYPMIKLAMTMMSEIAMAV